MPTQEVKIGHINIRSLLPSFNNLKDIIIDNDFSIFCISETWLAGDIVGEHLNIVNYSFIRRDRLSRGGEVAIYIKDSLNYKVKL